MTRKRGLRHEVFEVGYLASPNRPMKKDVERLEEGTIGRASVYRRRSVDATLWRRASAPVFAHNHLNGNEQPSEHEKKRTCGFVLEAALRIKVIGYFVVSATAVISFRKEGLL
jgi:DNA repair protein RadC